MRGEALIDRKAALRSIVPPHEHLLFVDHVPGKGESLWGIGSRFQVDF